MAKDKDKNVIDINAARPTGKAPRISRAEIAATFRDALDGNPMFWPKIGRNFKVLADPKGTRTFLEITADNVARYVSTEALTNTLMRYSIQDLAEFSKGHELTLTKDKAVGIVEQWAACQPTFDLKTVRCVLEQSQKELCWHRLPFDYRAAPTELFDELMSRTDNAPALMAWVGSLFDERSTRQQYIWMYGHGMNGKGSILDFLKRVFGPSYKAEFPPTRGDRFWTHGLLGQRVVAFPDCTEPRFIQDGIFKSITGGDAVKTEEKGGKSTTSELICKVIFGANDKPKVTRGYADTRRIIYCEMHPLTKGTRPDAEYGEKLWAEGPAFLNKCRKVYSDMAQGSWIPVDGTKLEALINEGEEELSAVFNRYFEASPEASMIPAHLLWLLREKEKMSDQQIGAFKKFLRSRFGIERQVKWQATESVARYIGLGLKSAVVLNLKAELDRAGGTVVCEAF